MTQRTIDKLQALSNKKRLLICKHVINNGPTNVDTLARVIDLSQSATSQHLRILRETGLLRFEQRAQEYLYYWNATGKNAIFRSIAGFYDD